MGEFDGHGRAQRQARELSAQEVDARSRVEQQARTGGDDSVRAGTNQAHEGNSARDEHQGEERAAAMEGRARNQGVGGRAAMASAGANWTESELEERLGEAPKRWDARRAGASSAGRTTGASCGREGSRN